MRAIIYARVSTSEQTCENQVLALTEVAQHRGWELVEVQVDEGISGAKGRDKRPALDAVMRAVTHGRCDVVMAWSVDRLGRSLQDLVALLGDLGGSGCALYLHQQALDTTTPSGRAMFQMVGVFAEFERAMIQARIRAGLERARRRGKKLGRPRTPLWVRNDVLARHRRGESQGAIARACHIGRGTVQRILAADSKP